MKNVLFVTSFSEEKKKARLLYEIDLLQKNGYNVEVDYFDGKYSFLGFILSYLSLKFFNFHQVFQIKKKAKDFDYIIIYGMQALPGIIFAKSTKVIYQSLDDGVSYTIYELSKRFRPFKWIGKPLDIVFRFIEKALSKKADHILVNSIALNDYLEGSKLNYYTSPLEGLKLTFNPENPYAFLYLGQLRVEKGTLEMKKLAEKFNLQCHVFGISVDTTTDSFITEKYVTFYGNKTVEELLEDLPKLSIKFNLIGVSLIENVHHSYATQEANKDIDYMGMGMPFVGNERITTKAKIDAGCGSFVKDFDQLLNADNYRMASEKAYELYKQEYASEKFNKTFLACLS